MTNNYVVNYLSLIIDCQILNIIFALDNLKKIEI